MPIALFAAAILLFVGVRARLGFYIVLINLALYEAFMCAEVFARQAPIGFGDWLFFVAWTLVFAVALVLARLAMAMSHCPTARPKTPSFR
jgi:hypothetical protein